jgi:hypothetical protein
MAIEISLYPELNGLTIGAVELTNVQVRPSSVELRAWSDEVAQQAVAEAEFQVHKELRQQIRQMLRHGHLVAIIYAPPMATKQLYRATQSLIENFSKFGIGTGVGVHR